MNKPQPQRPGTQFQLPGITGPQSTSTPFAGLQSQPQPAAGANDTNFVMALLQQLGHAVATAFEKGRQVVLTIGPERNVQTSQGVLTRITSSIQTQVSFSSDDPAVALKQAELEAQRYAKEAELEAKRIEAEMQQHKP